MNEWTKEKRLDIKRKIPRYKAVEDVEMNYNDYIVEVHSRNRPNRLQTVRDGH